MGAAVSVKYAIPPWQMTRMATRVNRKKKMTTKKENKKGIPK